MNKWWETRMDTRLPQARAGGHIRGHLTIWTGAVSSKNEFIKKFDRSTDKKTDGQSTDKTQ